MRPAQFARRLAFKHRKRANDVQTRSDEGNERVDEVSRRDFVPRIAQGSTEKAFGGYSIAVLKRDRSSDDRECRRLSPMKL
jgi:hypothetical protein